MIVIEAVAGVKQFDCLCVAIASVSKAYREENMGKQANI